MSGDVIALPLELAEEDYSSLIESHKHLEHPNLVARLTALAGDPIEHGFKLLPTDAHSKIQKAVDYSMQKTLTAAVSSLKLKKVSRNRNRHYQMLSSGVGAVGGYFGLPALLLELPVSTALMMRSISEIAIQEGECIESLETRMACLQVFAFGSNRAESDDAADTGYYGVRIAMALSIRNSIQHLSQYGYSQASAPLLTKLSQQIAARFGVLVSEKAAAQMLPVVGAAGGAAVNLLFMQHFQTMAKAHFTVRRLERKYGEARVREEYLQLSL